MYPPWPSLSSMDGIRQRIVDYIPNGDTLFTEIDQITPEIEIYSAKVFGVPVFIKEDCNNLGRGSLDHELRIGYQVNSLRSILPNFNTTYVKILGNRWKPDCILSEYVPHPPLYDLIKSLSFEKLFSYYVQTILAMEIAHMQIGLVHNDLTISNIIGLQIPEKRTVKYGSILIETDHIPVIFDFDQSSCHGIQGSYGSDRRRDIYTCLFSLFRDYLSELKELYKWYNFTPPVDFTFKGLIASSEQGVKQMTPRTGAGLITFGQKEFGYSGRVKNPKYPMLEPEDI